MCLFDLDLTITYLIHSLLRKSQYHIDSCTSDRLVGHMLLHLDMGWHRMCLFDLDLTITYLFHSLLR